MWKSIMFYIVLNMWWLNLIKLFCKYYFKKWIDIKCYVFLWYIYKYEKFNDFSVMFWFVIVVLWDFSNICCGRNIMLWLKGKKKVDSECFLYWDI